MIDDFIGIYDECLTLDQCNSIISWFEDSKHLHSHGEIRVPNGNIVNKSEKDSTDIKAKMADGWYPSAIIFPPLKKCVSEYLKTYPFLDDKMDKFGLDSDYNIQRYYPGQGFFGTHCEHMTKTSKRVLAWTLYLNNVNVGGETEYTLYRKKVRSKSGRIVIFPAYWTHAHKGIVSKKSTKYLCTGWFSFL